MFIIGKNRHADRRADFCRVMPIGMPIGMPNFAE
jgi:hypothetical protein